MSIIDMGLLTKNYCEFNREERNYAAILYAALCRPGNAEEFLLRCKINANIGAEFGIYFEYSLLRDLWDQISTEKGEEAANAIKKDIIRQHLKISALDHILELPTQEMNKILGVGGRVSSRLQYPGRWSVRNLMRQFSGSDLRAVCNFKWAFNIKPDIVVHVDKRRAVCIEAKYQSKQGRYQLADSHDAKRILNQVGQYELQKYMLGTLVGFEVTNVLVANKIPKEHECCLDVQFRWADVFDFLDLKDMPDFVQHMVKKISAPPQQQCSRQ